VRREKIVAGRISIFSTERFDRPAPGEAGALVVARTEAFEEAWPDAASVAVSAARTEVERLDFARCMERPLLGTSNNPLCVTLGNLFHVFQ
jgi:hypothetical protein